MIEERADALRRVGRPRRGGEDEQPRIAERVDVRVRRGHELIAIAQDDDRTDPQSKNTLREAFSAAGLKAEIEVYAGDHGWCPPDSPAYNEAQAERAWTRLLALFETALA